MLLKNFLCALLLFCLYGAHSSAQTKVIDSLSRAIEDSNSPLKKGALYLQRSKSWPAQQYDKIIADGQQSLNYFQQLSDTLGLVDAGLQLAYTYSKQNKYETAISFDNFSLQLAEKKGYEKGHILALAHRGRNYAALGDRVLAEKDFLTALSRCTKGGYETEAIAAYNGLGVLYRQMGKYEESLKNLDRLIEISEKHQQKPVLATALMNKANTLAMLAKYEDAMSFHLKSLNIKEQLNDKVGLLQSYNNMGILLRSMKDYEKSIEYYKKALQLSVPAKVYGSIGNNYSNLAISYIDINKNLDSVPYFFQQAIAAFERVKEPSGLAMSLHNYGNFLMEKKKDYEAAEKLLQNALSIRKKLSSAYDVASTMNALGTLKQRQGAHKEAEQLLLSALGMLKTENGVKKKDAYLRLAQFYRENGDLEKAYEYQAGYAAMQDTLLTEGEVVSALKLQNGYEVEKKNIALNLANKENQLNKLTISKHQQQLWFLGVVVVLLVLLSLLLYRSYLHKKEHAQVLALKNEQIETLIREQHHRVKNNLQVISALLSLQRNKIEDEVAKDALEEGKLRVDAMAMIHQKLYMDEHLTTINMKEYVSNLGHSLADSYGYHGNVVKTHIDLPDKNLDIDLAIPVGLIINELISNSFKYAFRQQDQPEIKISMMQDEHRQTELVIADNGKENWDAAQGDFSQSFGLKLIKTLVKQLQGTLKVQNIDGTKYTIVFKTS